MEHLTGGRHKAIVAALAGRRIDARGDDTKQFPIENAPAVREALRALLRRERVGVLVSSAACGADLLALEVALGLDINCHVILPFNRETFRNTSVIDRPGDWGALYDFVLKKTSAANTLTVLENGENNELAYRAVTERIIHDAIEIAAPQHPLAIIVWEGRPRPDKDATADFQRLAQAAGLSERIVSTC